ncbi:hypothetical protein B0H19DRAFT_1260280 [Mycena capillaripes]|nr:hypothetical protein B0H19DRAFT_1260280 [Mycena capillaripes]
MFQCFWALILGGGEALISSASTVCSGNSSSTNVAAVWEPSTANTTTKPVITNGSCTFWDGLTCSGNEASSNYTPGFGGCVPARSMDGILNVGPAFEKFNVVAEQWKISRFFHRVIIPEYESAPNQHQIPGIAIHLRRWKFNMYPPPILSCAQNIALDPIVQHLQEPIFLNITARLITLYLDKPIRPNAVSCVFCIWRARRKYEEFLPMQVYFPPPHEPPVRKKPGAGATVTVPVHRSPGANQELGRNNDANWDGRTNLELAMRQNDVLEARISALERELKKPNMGPEVSGSSPPGYQD